MSMLVNGLRAPGGHSLGYTMATDGPLAIGNDGASGRTRVVFDGQQHIWGERRARLDWRQTYYDCTQHDWKRYDFDGRPLAPGPRYGQPATTVVEKMPWAVPLSVRRPSVYYRMSKVIVDAFTNLLFGEGRFPEITYVGDSKSEDFARALVQAQRLGVKIVQARTIGGACGSVALSWRFDAAGRPRCEVHNPKNIWIESWEDRAELIPRVAIESYLFVLPVMGSNGRVENATFWWRRDWTPEGDIVYQPVPYVPKQEPVWTVDTARTNMHGDGVCRLQWIQNLPSEEVDGIGDCEGLYEACDMIDLLSSVVAGGAIKNLDPTLVLNRNHAMAAGLAKLNQGAGGVKKGSDNALDLAIGESATYLEMGGQSIAAGISLLTHLRGTTLETAQCVIPDPATIAAQGISSLSIKAIYQLMLGKSGIHRGQYGAGIERMIDQQVNAARRAMRSRVVVTLEDGSEEQRIQTVTLPPLVVEEPILDEFGVDTGEVSISFEARFPGDVQSAADLRWPEYFPPTPADRAAEVTTLGAATGGRQILSARTATERIAVVFGVNPADELKRIEEEQSKKTDNENDMFRGFGFGGGAGNEPKRLSYTDPAPELDEDPEEPEDNAPPPPDVNGGA